MNKLGSASDTSAGLFPASYLSFVDRQKENARHNGWPRLWDTPTFETELGISKNGFNLLPGAEILLYGGSTADFLWFRSRVVNKEAIKHYDKCHRQCPETAKCQECRFMAIFLNKDCSKLTSYRFVSQNISPSPMISHHMGTFRNSWKF